MAIHYGLQKSLLTIVFSLALTACGGSEETPKPLTCAAPKVLSSAGNTCVDPEPVNTAPEITSSDSFAISEDAQVGDLAYQATFTDAEGDDVTWQLVDSQDIFSIAADGAISLADKTNLIAANLANYSIQISAADAELTTSQTITVTVTESEQVVQPSVLPEDNQAIIYYKRSDELYDGWTIHAWNNDSCDGYADFGEPGSANAGTEWTAGLVATGQDDNYGAYWLIDTKADASCLNFILHNGDEKDPNDNDQLLELSISTSVFVVSGDKIYTNYEDVLASEDGEANAPSIQPTSAQGIIYYYRQDGNYDGWALHAWNNDTCNAYADFGEPGSDDAGTAWESGLAPTGEDDNYGAYWLFDTKAGADCANFIIHNGDAKDPNDTDNSLPLSGERWIFVVSGVGMFSSFENLTTEQTFGIAGTSAHWIAKNKVVWNSTGNDVRLVYSEEGTLDNNFSIANSVMLTPSSLTEEQASRAPHLATWQAYSFNATEAELEKLIKSQIVLVSLNSEGEPVSGTYVQHAKALDDIYTSGTNDADEATLGIEYLESSIKTSVWAPTAKNMLLNVYNQDKSLLSSHQMVEDVDTGIWSFTSDTIAQFDRKYYRFEVTVYHPISKRVETIWSTDPYSVNTSTNGLYSQYVNLTDNDLSPEGWDSHAVPTITNIEDAVLLEGHIRDFSAQDETVSQQNRGKYLAFTESGSDAVSYLERLAQAGVTHFHMLPANDIASVDESVSFNLDSTVAEACAIAQNLSICSTESDSDTLNSIFKGFNPATLDAAKLMDEIRGYDSFNWGYDPHHFNAVEGSYASSAEGVERIIEFRQMVQALHETGLRVVLDVVYNHTSSSGLYDKSVFDKLVPGYYHRYSEITGEMERSTCCENTATEHRMMGKFVVDSLVHWAEHFGLDGFRFDVMGHMPKDVILDGRDAVAEIDSDTYFYGEGWNWGEVVDNRLFEQATQYNLADSKVGTFNDRPRDAIRSASLSKDSVSLSDVDHIRLGLAGTLQNFELIDQNGNKRIGKNFGQSSYALTPSDIINYVSKHDNETLWDALQYGIEQETSSSERVRIHNLSAAIPLLSQGIPFFQLGVDKMRSKSMHRNTYDFGDWYNFIDYTNMSNNWNVGLPTPTEYGYNFNGQQADSNHGEGWKWTRIGQLSGNDDIALDSADIHFSEDVFEEFLQIRSTSALFRLTTEQDVINRVGFHNTGEDQTPGLIVMSIDDGLGVTDLDNAHDAVVVIINGTDEQQTQSVKSASDFELHSIQNSGADSIVQTSTFSENETHGTFTVPAYSVAIFVKPQGSSQGMGLNPDPEFVASPYADAEISVVGLNTNNIPFEYDGRGVYQTSATLNAGTYEFTIASADETVNLSFSDISLATDSVAMTEASSGEIEVDISSAGTYQITLDVTKTIPELSMSLLNALVSCDTPVSAGDAPFDIAGGGSLYIRGDHSGWGATDSYKFTYTGNNTYQVNAEFDGAMQFKLASDDGSWTTQLWVQNSDGTINTSDLEVGIEYDVAYGDAGESNNSITLTQGQYQFTLTLDEANPSKETKPAGSLLVAQCSE